jgi:type II secretory pathway component PulF
MVLFGVMLVVVLFVLLIIVGTGVAAFLAKSTVAATVCEVISRITFVAALLTLITIVMPRLVQTYIGFGVELPWITMLVLNCTVSTLWQSILLGVLLVAGGVADGLLFATFHDQQSTRRTTQWCSFLFTLFLTMMAFFLIAALYIPMIRLMNDLS